jgi:hypothetical protein
MKRAPAIACILTWAVCGALAGRADATSIGAAIGYGTPGGDPNAFGLGFQGRLGFSLPFNIYAGGSFVYHLGTSNEIAGVKTSNNAWYAGGEIGYDIPISDSSFMIRPLVGLGGLVLRTEICSGGDCIKLGSRTSVYVAPTVYGQYDFGPVYVGADVRYVIATAMTSLNSFGFFGTVGVDL